jgi:hypothetical protein
MCESDLFINTLQGKQFDSGGKIMTHLKKHLITVSLSALTVLTTDSTMAMMKSGGAGSISQDEAYRRRAQLRQGAPLAVPGTAHATLQTVTGGRGTIDQEATAVATQLTTLQAATGGNDNLTTEVTTVTTATRTLTVDTGAANLATSATAVHTIHGNLDAITSLTGGGNTTLGERVTNLNERLGTTGTPALTTLAGLTAIADALGPIDTVAGGGETDTIGDRVANLNARLGFANATDTEDHIVELQDALGGAAHTSVSDRLTNSLTALRAVTGTSADLTTEVTAVLGRLAAAPAGIGMPADLVNLQAATGGNGNLTTEVTTVTTATGTLTADTGTANLSRAALNVRARLTHLRTVTGAAGTLDTVSTALDATRAKVRGVDNAVMNALVTAIDHGGQGAQRAYLHQNADANNAADVIADAGSTITGGIDAGLKMIFRRLSAGQAPALGSVAAPTTDNTVRGGGTAFANYIAAGSQQRGGGALALDENTFTFHHLVDFLMRNRL